MGVKPGKGVEGISDSICLHCAIKQMPEVDMKSPMTIIEHDLHHSASEEHLAAAIYRERAKLASALGDPETAALYEHIAEEEDGHEREFNQRFFSIRVAAREISQKVVGSAWLEKVATEARTSK
jgi:rubrerythrin